MVEVSRKFQDTPIGGKVSSVHPGMILGWSEYPGNPRILKQGEDKLCPSQDDQGMVDVSRESQDTQTEGGELCPSQDDPGMIEVSRESQDTQYIGK